MPEPEQWIKTEDGGLVRFSDISRIFMTACEDGKGKVGGRLWSTPQGGMVTLATFDTEAEAEAFLVYLAEQLGAKTLAEIDLTQ